MFLSTPQGLGNIFYFSFLNHIHTFNFYFVLFIIWFNSFSFYFPCQKISFRVGNDFNSQPIQYSLYPITLYLYGVNEFSL